MDDQVLTGDAAQKALRSHDTEGRCGYFEMYYKQVTDDAGRWVVWDHRDSMRTVMQQDSEEACKRYLL